MATRASAWVRKSSIPRVCGAWSPTRAFASPKTSAAGHVDSSRSRAVVCAQGTTGRLSSPRSISAARRRRADPGHRDQLSADGGGHGRHHRRFRAGSGPQGRAGADQQPSLGRLRAMPGARTTVRELFPATGSPARLLYQLTRLAGQRARQPNGVIGDQAAQTVHVEWLIADDHSRIVRENMLTTVDALRELAIERRRPRSPTARARRAALKVTALAYQRLGDAVHIGDTRRAREGQTGVAERRARLLLQKNFDHATRHRDQSAASAVVLGSHSWSQI